MPAAKQKAKLTKHVPSTQAERRARSEERILEAAVRLIGQRGTLATTLADVGEEAGYSRGLPAHLFGSKEALLARAARELMNFGLFSLASEGGLPALLDAIKAWLDLVMRQPHMGRALHVLMSEAIVGEMRERTPVLFTTVRELDQRARQHFRRFLEVAKLRGEIRADVDADAEAAIMLASIRGIMDQWFISPNKFDLAGVGEYLVRDLKRNLALPKVAAEA